jgi:hypothetical protein
MDLRTLLVIGVMAAFQVSGPILRAQGPIRATTDDGRKVLLAPDGSWKFNAPPPVSSKDLRSYRKASNASMRVTMPYGDAVLSIDPSKWKEASRKDGQIIFRHSNGKLFGLVQSENLGGIPTGSMKEVALLNAQKMDPNATAFTEERCMVNGREVLYLELKATRANIPFHFAGYYHGGVKSDLQVVAYTLESEFNAAKPELEEFINGLDVREASSPELAPVIGAPNQLGSISFGQFRLNYKSDEWTASRVAETGTWQLNHKKGDAYVKFIAERTEIPTDVLSKAALDRVRELDPEMRILKEDKRSISGVEVMTIRFDAVPKGIPLSFLAYYYGGKEGSVQILGWAGQNMFVEKRADLQELLDGLTVVPERQ